MKTLLRCTRPIHLLSVHHRNVSALVKPEYGSDSPFPTQENRHAWTNTNPNYVTKLHDILQKCAKEREPTQGRACHSQIIQYGLQSDTTTVNILLNMYSKCGFVGDARQLFDEMPDRSLVSWNTMIYSYTKNGDEAVALDLFVQMQREGTQFSEFTVSSVLCACASNVAVFECKQLHALAIKASVVTNVFVGTALIDVYGKCSLVKDAVRVFECMPDKSAVTWSSMVSGYVRNAHYEKALVMFRRMNAIGLELNQFIISSVLSACAAIAARIDGNQIHAVLYKFGFHANVFVASSLVDMYSKCGCIKEAYGVFSTTEEMNLVLWNAMISGFSRHACSIEAMLLFEKMQQIGLQPNEVTYVSVLSACGHMGLVKEGKRYFYTMMREHNVEPNIFHYACMVDVLGRTGLIDEAIDLIHKMPFQATASMWGSLLASCRVHGNIEVAKVAARHLFEIEPENAGNHVLLSNIYAANKKWEEVAQARKLLKESEAKKERGKSWIEIKDKVHIFMVGERNHPRIAEIYSRLEDILEKMEKLGYRGETAHDLHDVEENWKQELLRHHSEKLALVFGLMCLPSSAPVRIMKNLRICGDCHVFMKFASSITGREIIVRDTNRFHNFRNGLCSCGEFW